MNAWLRRASAWWHKIFFWQAREESSEQFKPDAGHDHTLVLSVTNAKRMPRWYQLRFLHRVLSKQEQRMFWSCFLVCLFSLAIASGVLLQPHISVIPRHGGTMTEALVGAPKLLNPLHAPQNDVDRDLVSLIYSGLFRVDANLEPQPDLVDNYRWLEDNKTLEVVLRKDAYFHDGLPVTASDVVFTYQAVKNPAWKSTLAPTFKDVDVTRVDDQTVQFHLPNKNPAFLYDLTLGIMPAHIWEDVEGANAALADANIKPIGSGPYRVNSFTRDSRGVILNYHLRVDPNYYGIQPNISDLILRFYPDRDQALHAIESNQVDALAFVPWGDAAKIKNANIHSVGIELPQETVAFFNTKDSLLDDVNLRQALALAIDPHELDQLMNHHASAVDGPFPFLATTSSTTRSVADLDAARQALTNLHWTLDPGASIRTYQAPTKATTKKSSKTSIPAPAAIPLHLTINVPNQPDLLQVAEVLKRRWSLIGAAVDIKTADATSLMRDALDQRDYQILITNVLLGPNQDLAPFWSSDQISGHGRNLSNLADHNVDLALAAIKNVTTTEALLQARQTLATAIMSKTPALFLLRPAYAYLVSNHIQGTVNMHIGQPSDRLLQTASWYIDTGWSWK